MGIHYNHFTLGIEEEFMVIDPVTKELKSHEQKIVTEGQKLIKDKVKAEMHQAVVEVGTDICRDAEEAYKDVFQLRQTIKSISGSLGLSVGASGTHPFSHWQSQMITDRSWFLQNRAKVTDNLCCRHQFNKMMKSPNCCTSGRNSVFDGLNTKLLKFFKPVFHCFKFFRRMALPIFYLTNYPERIPRAV